MDQNLPFNEKWISETKSIRRFSPDVDDEELKWHFDNEDRIVECSGKTDWKFQFDNQLPITVRGVIKIPKGEWHRLIKGLGDLEVSVTRTEFV